MSSDLLDDRHAEEAIAWMVELNAGDHDDDLEKKFSDWLASDIRNETAWVAVQTSLSPCVTLAAQDLPQGILARSVLQRSKTRRAVLASAVGLVATGATGLLVADRIVPLGGLLADESTGTAQRKDIVLADGRSLLVLKPRTSIDLVSDRGDRAVRLKQGALLVDVAPTGLPFDVFFDRFQFRTSAGQFMVDFNGVRSVITGIENTGVVHSSGNIDLSGRGEEIAIGPGEEIVLEGGRSVRRSINPEVATAWTRGILIAEDDTVASVVEGLRPYFAGYIRVDPAVADLRVSGVFSLQDPVASVNTLARSMNLSVASILGRWLTLGPDVA